MSAHETKPETVGFRLAPQQERLFSGADDLSVVQCAAVLTGPVDETTLRDALGRTLARHEILRTTFARAAAMRGRSQVIAEVPTFGWSTEADGIPLDALIVREAETSLDLESGPLLRAVLVGPSEERVVLLLTVHAACADAQSLLLLLDETAQTLASSAEPEEPVQYADYAEWRHELLSGDDERAADGRAFWTSQNAARPAAPRLLFGTRGGSSRRARCVRVNLDPGLLESAGTDAGVFLEACWHALIARLTGAGELITAGWCDGRSQPDLRGAIGPYAQPVPIRSRLEESATFAEMLDQIARGRAQAAAWQDYASAQDLKTLEVEAIAGFIHVDHGPLSGSVDEILALNPASDARLLLCMRSNPHGLTAEIWHDPAAYDESDATELAERLRILVTSAAADPTQPLARLPLIDEPERAGLIASAAGPAPAADADIPIHELFERQARATPDAPALADGEADRSYRAVNAAANRLAHVLAELGATRGAKIGLCMERTPAMLEAVLGILKAGGAYVPLNFDHPAARLSHQLSDCGAEMLVTEQHLLQRFDFAGTTVCLDRDRERIAASPDHDPAPLAAPEDPVYVIYTSGSTGVPKGVGVTHRNLSNYAVHIAQRLRGGDEEHGGLRYGVVSAISTDLGNTSIFPALISGGCVHLISAAASMDSAAMAAELRDMPLDVLKITPSHLGALLAGDHPRAILPRRWLVLGGEPLSWDLFDRIRSTSPSCAVVNHYGPTETTVGCCAYDVSDVRSDALTVPIGRPLAGVRAYVLDRALEPLPAGVPGELCIAGEGVASGYVGRGEDSGSMFVGDPFSSDGTPRMYRTGDRARFLRDGAIEFLGRLDDQLKVRGFRVEPGEIETVLLRHPVVRQAAVVPEHDDRGGARLVGYIATAADPSVEDLQAFLSESLPEYMVPASFVKLDSLPFTPSGKIDRSALPALREAAGESRREAEFVAPRDAVEEEIATIWADLLGVEQVGVFDDFFALGGHSLLATQAIMRIRRAHANIPLRALLAAPTVADLAAAVRASAADSQ